MSTAHETPPDFYADSVVVAYRTPTVDRPLNLTNATITSSNGPIDAGMLTDGDLVKKFLLNLLKEVGGKAWIQFVFSEEETIRSVSIVAGRRGIVDDLDAHSGIAFEASNDGVDYRVVAPIPVSSAAERTISFAPVMAKFFRVTFESLPPQPNPLARVGMGGPTLPSPIDFPISELVLSHAARVAHFEEKAAFVPATHL